MSERPMEQCHITPQVCKNTSMELCRKQHGSFVYCSEQEPRREKGGGK